MNRPRTTILRQLIRDLAKEIHFEPCMARRLKLHREWERYVRMLPQYMNDFN